MRKLLLLLFIVCLEIPAMAQTKRVILEGFLMGPHWDGTTWDTVHTWGVQCPSDPRSFPATKQWYYDKLAAKASAIAAGGFTAVWLPSVAKGSAGYYGYSLRPKQQKGAIYDVGYGIFDDYDLGDKLQNGSLPTRYGTRGQLTRCVAMMHANGLDVYHDFVLNQRNAANMTPKAPLYQWFEYKDAFGNNGGGRFPKYTTDFHNMVRGGPGAPGGKIDPHTPASVYPDGTPTHDEERYWGPDFAHITGQKGYQWH